MSTVSQSVHGAASSPSSHRVHVPPPSPSTGESSDDSAEWKSLEIEAPSKTWKDNIYVPLGILGGAVAVGGALVMRGRGDGRSLSQRVMEARVGVQAAVLLGLVTVGYAFSRNTKREDE
jgi:hypothetical protein